MATRQWRKILRKRHWFDRGENASPRFYRNEPIVTDVEASWFIRHSLPVPRWLWREWDHVSRHGWIDADVIGIRDVVWPESAARIPPGLKQS
jgi:hypothetical protein